MKSSKHIPYGFGRVDVSDIALDVMMHHVNRPVDAAHVPLLDVNEITRIIEDTVEGVRALLNTQSEITMTTMQLETLLQRRVRWAGSGVRHQEYIVGENKQMRVRVRDGHLFDVMDKVLTVQEIQANT